MDAERRTRNWEELLQELRVVQTGTQILTGFLLTVPFSSRFEDLTDQQRLVYLAVLMGSVVTTTLVLAPVAFHRMLFRRRQRPWLVEAGNVFARAGLGMLALTSAGAVLLVFDVVVGRPWSYAAGLSTLALFLAVWLALPLLRGGPPPDRH